MKKLSKLRGIKRYIYFGCSNTKWFDGTHPHMVYYKDGCLICVDLITKNESYFTRAYSCRHALLEDIKDGYHVIYDEKEITKYLMGIELSR